MSPVATTDLTAKKVPEKAETSDWIASQAPYRSYTNHPRRALEVLPEDETYAPGSSQLPV